MATFKAGDKVYCPMFGTEVYTLKEHPNMQFSTMLKSIGGTYETFTETGTYHIGMGVPSIFHATPENRKKLEDLYGLEFEEPKRKLKGSELCKRLLKTQRYVLCFVSDCNDNTALKDRKVEAISRVSSGSEYFMDLTNIAWVYAVPINPETLQPLEIEVDDE